MNCLLCAGYVPTYHIETANDIDVEALSQFEKVGVTAGASTPEFVIQLVCARLEQIAPQTKTDVSR